VSNQLTPKGIDTPDFQTTLANQKVGDPGRVGAAFHNAHYGSNNTKGK
jgi:hypothetical protein